jgi:hypothetical protein
VFEHPNAVSTWVQDHMRHSLRSCRCQRLQLQLQHSPDVCTDKAPAESLASLGASLSVLLMAECQTTSPKCPPLCQILSSLSTLYCLQTLRQISVDFRRRTQNPDDREPRDVPRPLRPGRTAIDTSTDFRRLRDFGANRCYCNLQGSRM